MSKRKVPSFVTTNKTTSALHGTDQIISLTFSSYTETSLKRATIFSFQQTTQNKKIKIKN